MVLTNARPARRLQQRRRPPDSSGGRKLEGLRSPSCSSARPSRCAMRSPPKRDTLFTIESADESEIYHLSQRGFVLNSAAAPVVPAEAAHARARRAGSRDVEEGDPRDRARAQQLARADLLAGAFRPPDSLPRPTPTQLERIFRTIEDRAAHLQTFIDGYARFAKLPRPRPEPIDWGSFLARSQARAVQARERATHGPAQFDPAQIEQVLINLVKNAHEAGSAAEEVRIAIESGPAAWQLQRARPRCGMVGRRPAQRAAAVLFDQADGQWARVDAVPRGHRGARRPDFAREPRGGRDDRDLVDTEAAGRIAAAAG